MRDFGLYLWWAFCIPTTALSVFQTTMDKSLLEKKKKGYGRAFFILIIATTVLGRGEESIIKTGGVNSSTATFLIAISAICVIGWIYALFMWSRTKYKIEHLND